MRWIIGILMMGLFVVQSAVIVWQRSILSSATERRVEADATVRSLQQRIDDFDRSVAENAAGRQSAERESQSLQSELRDLRNGHSTRLLRAEQDLEASVAERKRAAAALALAEKELAEQRENAGKFEQELSLVRAELMWQKVRGSAAGAAQDGAADPARAQKQLQKQPEKQASPVVTAHSTIAAGTPAAHAVPSEAMRLTDGTPRLGEADGAAASVAAPPKKAVRREARRIRKDAPADEPVFSFLP